MSKQTKDDQNSSYRIETGIPTPGRGRGLFPFDQMKVGESFVVPKEEAVSLRSAAWYFGKSRQRKFCIRQNSDGDFRCWRES